MRTRTNPLDRHRDHLALIDGMIADTQSAISKRQEKIRAMLETGGDPAPAANALRENWNALKRLQADREATLNLLARHGKSQAQRYRTHL